MSRSKTRCTSDSLRLRYSIRSAMVPILSLCWAAKSMRSGSRDKREHVARLDDVLGLGVGRRGDLDGQRAVLRRDAGGDTLGGLDRGGEVGAVARAVLLDHRPQAQALRMRLGDRHADQAAAVL